jgi:hypothetical protein
MAQAHDGKQAFKVDHFTCHAGKYLAKKRRMDAEAAERSSSPEGWNDGRHYYVRPIEDTRERRDRGN